MTCTSSDSGIRATERTYMQHTTMQAASHAAATPCIQCLLRNACCKSHPAWQPPLAAEPDVGAKRTAASLDAQPACLMLCCTRRAGRRRGVPEDSCMPKRPWLL